MGRTTRIAVTMKRMLMKAVGALVMKSGSHTALI